MSNPELGIDEEGDGGEYDDATVISLDIPYSIMGVDGPDEGGDVIQSELRSRDSSGYGGGKYTHAEILGADRSSNGNGWCRYTIRYVKGYDV